MTAVTTIARRTFLVGSVALGSGVAFGFYNAKKAPVNPLLKSLEDGEASFNPWVKITPEKIILITPHVDIGQGAASMQAALIAEELDIEFGQFEIDFGEPDKAYYNRAMGGEMVPFMSTDKTLQAKRMRGLMGGLTKILGVQGTGGSSSVPDSFDKLRLAGAVARETLKKAAAKKSGVAISALTTSGGKVHLPDGTSLAYTKLAADAAKIKPVTNVTLREPKEWRLIGKPMKRLDITAKSTGTLAYGIDLSLENMVYAAVKTNPRQGGEMKSYDARAAEKMRGVLKVLPVTGGVAIIANNTWRAFQAVNAVNFNWGPAPYPAEQADHWAELAASFTPARLDKQWRHDGDVAEDLDKAGQGNIISAEYKAPYVAHQPLEPIGALILVTDERVDIWVAHQIPGFVVSKTAEITGHKPDQVHIHNLYCGGSFGHRLEFENVNLAAEIGNQMRGTPVKLTFSREEDFAHDFPRQITMARGRGRVEDGQVKTYDLQIASVSSSASQSARLGMAQLGSDRQIVAGAWNQPFKIPNFRMRAYKTPELAPTSSWRSVGASTAGFFADCFLDELIRRAGADPLAERLRLVSNPVARRVLEAVGEMSNWGAPLGDGRGRGLAFVNSFGVPVAEVVEVTHSEAGFKIDKVFVAADVGRIVDPVNFDNHVKGAVVWALGHAMNCEITYKDGMAEQTNYHAHEGMRFAQCPEIHVRGLETSGEIRGIGEPPVPPAAPALANAIFDASAIRLREMPFHKFVKFV